MPLALHQLGEAVLSFIAAGYKEIARLLSGQALTYPAARCGLETAVIDAHCRTSNIPMWRSGVARMCERGRRISRFPCPTSTKPSPWPQMAREGVSPLQNEVGKDVENDIRLWSRASRIPGILFIGDGNQASRARLLTFAKEGRDWRDDVCLNSRGAERSRQNGGIRRETGIPVAGMNQFRSLADAQEVVAEVRLTTSISRL